MFKITQIICSLIIPTILLIINVIKIINYDYKNNFFVFSGIAKPILFGLNFFMISELIYTKLIKDNNIYISTEGTIILFILLIITLSIEKYIKLHTLKKEKSASNIYSKEKNWYK